MREAAMAQDGRRVPELLIGALLGQDRLRSEHDVATVLTAAAHHRVVPWLDRIDHPELVAAARASRADNTRTQLRIRADLMWLGAFAGRLDVPLVVLKGPALASRFDTGMRTYADLDVLVAPEHFATLVRALRDAEAHHIDRNWDLYNQLRFAEMHFRLPSGTTLDLHWHLFNVRSARRSTDVDVAGLVADRVPLDLGSLVTSQLPTRAHLGYVAAHAAWSGGNRLLWLEDVRRLTTEVEDWRPVVAWVQAAGLELPTTTMLARADLAFGLDLTRHLATNTAVRSWSALVRAASRVSPVAESDGGSSVARVVAKSARATVGASLRELWRRSRTRIEHLQGWENGDERRDLPSALLVESGTDRDLDRYLDGVASGRVDD